MTISWNVRTCKTAHVLRYLANAFLRSCMWTVSNLWLRLIHTCVRLQNNTNTALSLTQPTLNAFKCQSAGLSPILATIAFSHCASPEVNCFRALVPSFFSLRRDLYRIEYSYKYELHEHNSRGKYLFTFVVGSAAVASGSLLLLWLCFACNLS